MRALIVAVGCGLLFGAGMVVSDMINPARVLAFLDVTGAWDPSLAFVMGGALIPSSIAYLIRRRLDEPVAADAFHVPDSRRIDRALVGGAVMFGLGWGLVGLCPGPALAALTTGAWQAFAFVAAMIAGMALFRLTLDRNC
ncbi:MAG: transporter [Sphingomonadales bacterium RIFCSPHIGHO2_01_FULL_65_20]|nr:YeeE/YedE family protein [Alphaproteobacteria bacterium]MBU2378387.1 YeeE/YedE family protein [Alphaproteobacteria bacterium]OHC91658.1 MAG: transporter [Sphingomonadales bacterium RIFCSPHIGHO2_01_FULL_65_20]